MDIVTTSIYHLLELAGQISQFANEMRQLC